MRSSSSTTTSGMSRPLRDVDGAPCGTVTRRGRFRRSARSGSLPRRSTSWLATPKAPSRRAAGRCRPDVYAATMGKVFDGIDEALASWIAAQPMWFVATAPLAVDGRVNVSPRGHDSFSVLGAHRVGWVDYTGSGVETIAHLRENGRICVMFASFDRRPRIVRLHGRGMVALAGEVAYEQVVALHPAHPGTRAVVVVDIERASGHGLLPSTEERCEHRRSGRSLIEPMHGALLRLLGYLGERSLSPLML